MEEINALYARLLHLGLITLRQAICAGKTEWAKLEVEMLHNLPTLINDTSIERHRYYWFVERDLYVQRVLALADGEPASRMRTYYEPIWREMEPLISAILQPEPRSGEPNRAEVA